MEKVLLFQIQDSDADRIRDILGSMKIRMQIVPREQFRQTLGCLNEGNMRSETEVYRGEAPEGSLLLMCGFSDKQMDHFLAALKKKLIRTDYKAILTPVNRNWNVLRLYAELEREKKEYRKLLGK